MLKLWKASPYGLNVNTGVEHQRDSDVPIGTSFPSLKGNKKNIQLDQGIRPLVKIIQSKAFLIYIKMNYKKIWNLV